MTSRRAGRIAWLAAAVVFVGTGRAPGAELYARKMEIVRTPEGEVTVFRDSVVITDGDTRIEARLARLFESRGLAVISDSVRITDPEAEIRADSARYWFGEKRAELFGDVRVRQESLDITAPRLLYRSEGRKVTADSGVTLEDVKRSFRLAGSKGTYDLDSSVGTVDSLPVLSWARGEDSARVTSRRMTWYENGSRAAVDGDVRLLSGDTELECDTAVFFSGPDTGLAWGEPKVRDRSSSASGDTMAFAVRDGALRQVGIRGNAVGQYRTEGGDVVDVQGEEIELWIAAGDVERIEVAALHTGTLTRAPHAGRAGE